MDRLTCDVCGNGLLLDGEVRYEVKIEVVSAYDPLEVTDEDLQRDHAAEMKALVEKMKDMTQEQAMDQVYRAFRFDLCGVCQAAYIKDPLRRSR